MFMTARSQAQNAADAGALAGAPPFVRRLRRSGHQRSGRAERPRRRRGEQGHGRQRRGRSRGRRVPRRPLAKQPREGHVYRTARAATRSSHADCRYFGMATADISPRQRPKRAANERMTCVKPFTIPDKWIERRRPAVGRRRHLRRVRQQGNLLRQPGRLHSRRRKRLHRLQPGSDAASELMLRAGTGNNINRQLLFTRSRCGRPDHRRREYDWNIANCNTTVMHLAT